MIQLFDWTAARLSRHRTPRATVGRSRRFGTFLPMQAKKRRLPLRTERSDSLVGTANRTSIEPSGAPRRGAGLHYAFGTSLDERAAETGRGHTGGMPTTQERWRPEPAGAPRQKKARHVSWASWAWRSRFLRNNAEHVEQSGGLQVYCWARLSPRRSCE